MRLKPGRSRATKTRRKRSTDAQKKKSRATIPRGFTAPLGMLDEDVGRIERRAGA